MRSCSATGADMGKVRANLSEVLLAQGYQDLTGQIIRGVMKLVGELEIALADLVRLSRSGDALADPVVRRNAARLRSADPGHQTVAPL